MIFWSKKRLIFLKKIEVNILKKRSLIWKLDKNSQNTKVVYSKLPKVQR